MYKINKELVVQKMNRNMVIFDPQSSTMHTINTVGLFIFNKLKQGLDKSAISEALVSKYSIDKQKAAKDVEGFIKHLMKLKIIKEVNK